MLRPFVFVEVRFVVLGLTKFVESALFTFLRFTLGGCLPLTRVTSAGFSIRSLHMHFLPGHSLMKSVRIYNLNGVFRVPQCHPLESPSSRMGWMARAVSPWPSPQISVLLSCYLGLTRRRKMDEATRPLWSDTSFTCRSIFID